MKKNRFKDYFTISLEHTNDFALKNVGLPSYITKILQTRPLNRSACSCQFAQPSAKK